MRWDLLGEHNRTTRWPRWPPRAMPACRWQQGIAALARFRNVKRRMEVRGSVNGVTVYDDFAHHPTAIELTIAGLRSKVGKARILAVLEPRSNTMKTGRDEGQPGPEPARRRPGVLLHRGIGWDARAALAPLGAQAVTLRRPRTARRGHRRCRAVRATTCWS